MNAPVCITAFAEVKNRPTEHQDVLSLPRSSDDVVHTALDSMRAMLNCSGPASRWRRLPLDARRMICFGARLRPSEYADRDLDQMTPSEREQIRRAVMALQATTAEFGAGLLTRRDWMMIPSREVTDAATRQRETERRIELERQRSDLQARFSAITAPRG